MATQTLISTDANIDDVLAFPDGFVTDLSMTQPPVAYQVPDHSPARQCFTTRYFTLRGSRDLLVPGLI